MDTVEQVEQVDEVEALGGRIFEAALGAADICPSTWATASAGTAACRRTGPATAAELAGRTGTHERYAREWLEQQAVTGLLTVEDADDPADAPLRAARGARPRCSPTSEPHLPGARWPGCSPSAAIQLPALLDAYRNGGGVGWDAARRRTPASPRPT